MLRLRVVYQVVNMLVYFEPAALCDLQSTDILPGLLPASKQLWEADNEIEWKKALESVYTIWVGNKWRSSQNG